MKATTLFIRIVISWATLTCQPGFAQTSQGQPSNSPNASNEKIVRAYYTAFLTKDWNLMEGILADGFTFTSPLDDHISLRLLRKDAGQMPIRSKEWIWIRWL